MKNWKKKIKKGDCWDLKLIKLAVVAFMCFVISLWPIVGLYIMKVHWGWFLAATIILAWRPFKRMWM